MPAAINIHTGKIHTWFHDWKNSFIIIQCFEDLLQKYPEQNIYVIVDNWSAHVSYAIKVWAYLHSRLKIIYLPSNASWMNMIEKVFSKLEKELIRNSNFQTVTEMINAINNYFQKEQSFTKWCSLHM